MNHPKSRTAIVAALASLAFAGAASAQTCAEKATRLKTEVDALPFSSTHAMLSESLGIAMSADDTRCEEILERVENELEVSGEGHASGDQLIPNQPNTPADPPAAPHIRE